MPRDPMTLELREVRGLSAMTLRSSGLSAYVGVCPSVTNLFLAVIATIVHRHVKYTFIIHNTGVLGRGGQAGYEPQESPEKTAKNTH